MAISTIHNYFNRIATYISESLSKVIDPKYQKILFVALAAFAAIGTGYLVYQWRNKAAANNLDSRTQDLTKIIHAKVLATIENAENIPGLKSAEFKVLKPGLIQRWNELVEKKAIVLSGTDKDIRPYFVGLQAIIEHVLSNELNQSIKTLTGVIHTPMPATPLCTDGKVSPELVSADIKADPLRLWTVNARTTILRDYLFKGAELFVVYPKNGLHLRKPAEQKIYREELEKVKTSGRVIKLHDRPMKSNTMDKSLIGATYFFTDVKDQVHAFAIKMTQANAQDPNGDFGIWFGKASDPAIKPRLQAVKDYCDLNKQSPIDLPVF